MGDHVRKFDMDFVTPHKKSVSYDPPQKSSVESVQQTIQPKSPEPNLPGGLPTENETPHIPTYQAPQHKPTHHESSTQSDVDLGNSNPFAQKKVVRQYRKYSPRGNSGITLHKGWKILLAMGLFVLAALIAQLIR